MSPVDLAARLDLAFSARKTLVGDRKDAAVRLFAGFVEGPAELVVDLFGRTLVVHDYAEGGDEAAVKLAVDVATRQFPSVRAAVAKLRRSADPLERNGRVVLGEEKDLDRFVREDGVAYALALTMNRDASFYVDTRLLRAWARSNLAGKRVLNTFAYTGSLGVAAMAAPAREVLHVDRNKQFLNVAKDSYVKNGFPIRRADFLALDFFDAVSRLKREDALFDAVFVDPPFFSTTDRGKVDLEEEGTRVLDKVRPLVGHGGALVVVNNALFVSGAAWIRKLEAICASGYASIETLVGVPDDAKGYPETRVAAPPTDPSPFEHPTKIAVLRVERKDGRRA